MGVKPLELSVCFIFHSPKSTSNKMNGWQTTWSKEPWKSWISPRVRTFVTFSWPFKDYGRYQKVPTIVVLSEWVSNYQCLPDDLMTTWVTFVTFSWPLSIRVKTKRFLVLPEWVSNYQCLPDVLPVSTLRLSQSLGHSRWLYPSLCYGRGPTPSALRWLQRWRSGSHRCCTQSGTAAVDHRYSAPWER